MLNNPTDKPVQRLFVIGCCPFLSANPEESSKWYQRNFGIDLILEDYSEQPSSQKASPTVFTPFSPDISYFGDTTKLWINIFSGRNLDSVVNQLRSVGITVDIDAEIYTHGRFAHLRDPDGNPVELWEPKENF